jgi:hypothetical protein
MQIPESARLYSVLAPGKSVITIGFLQKAKDLINQISHLKAITLEKDDSIAQNQGRNEIREGASPCVVPGAVRTHDK